MNNFPGFFRFLWLFWMQPVTLHRRLKGWGVEDPGEPGFRLWRRRNLLSPGEKWWLRSLAQLLLFVTPILAFGISGVLWATGYHVAFSLVAVGVAGGMACGVAGGMAVGVGVGVAFGMAGGVAGGMASGVAGRAASGVAVGVASVASGVIFGVAYGVGAGVAFGATALVMYLHLPIYLIELLPSATAAIYGRLDWCPVRFHDLSYFPHPFLKRTIVNNAGRNPILARKVLESCAIAPGQRRAGRLAEMELQARDITQMIRAGKAVDLTELNGPWLPGRLGADPLLLAFSEAGQYLAAGRAAQNPHHRVGHLNRLAERVRAIETQLRQQPDTATRPFVTPLVELEAIAAEELGQARIRAERVLLNPFRAGEPLSPEEGAELFVGRQQAIRDIEDLLADSSRSASLVLIAPHRCGKTSLLKMLPARLPDAVCVFFDLQDNPVTSPASFFERLAERAVVAASKDRRLELPPLPPGPTIESARRWLDQLEEIAGERRILFAIDEFPRLEDLYPGSRQELLQLMGLIRATIQHKRRVRFLVSGVAPFDELASLWDDHFINTHQVRLGFLDAATTEQLLCHPAPGFPEDLISREVAAAVFERTGGQPYLVQMYGSKLVARLAAEPVRRNATREDVLAIEPRVFEAADSFFRHSFRSAPEDVRNALARLARGVSLDGETPVKVKRWLNSRNLLDDSARLSIPTFGTWIVKYADYARM